LIAQEAIGWYTNHERRDIRNFKSRIKYILEAFGDWVADEIKPSDIDSWLGAHDGPRQQRTATRMFSGKRTKLPSPMAR
jgi:hypothetical protein